jgi:DNA-binding response OmpR family regulator
MGAARILLIESTRAKRTSFVDALKKRYDVVAVPSGKQALQRAGERLPQAMVLDAISMRTPGDRICIQLREELPLVPLIHLHPGPRSAAESVADVVLFQPFTGRKLVNCIERLLQASDEEIVTCGPFTINLARRVLIANGQETQLTPKLALLVETFLRNPGQTLDRKLLMERVWHTDYLGDTRTLDVHIRWIRRAIEADPGMPRFLKTVRGVGYRLEIPDGTSPAPVIAHSQADEVAVPF